MNPQKVMEQPFITPGTTVEGVLLHLPLRPVALRFAFFLKFLAAWLKRPRFFFCEDAMAAWSSRPFVWTTANTRAFFLVARCFLFKEFLSRFLSRFFGKMPVMYMFCLARGTCVGLCRTSFRPALRLRT